MPTPKEMILLLNEAHRHNHPQVTNPTTAKNMREFATSIYKKYSQGKELPDGISVTKSSELSRYTYNLMIFCSCLTDLQLRHGLAEGNYLPFCKENNIYTRNLKEGNPFLLVHHAQTLHKMLANLKRSTCTAEEYNALNKAVVEFIETQLPVLAPEYYAALKSTLSGYADLLLAGLIQIGPSSNHSMFQALLAKAKDQFCLATELTRDRNDRSVAIYHDPHIIPALLYANPEDAMGHFEHFEHFEESRAYPEPR